MFRSYRTDYDYHFYNGKVFRVGGRVLHVSLFVKFGVEGEIGPLVSILRTRIWIIIRYQFSVHLTSATSGLPYIRGRIKDRLSVVLRTTMSTYWDITIISFGTISPGLILVCSYGYT